VFVTRWFLFVENVGIQWTDLKEKLNQEFDWENLIINTPNMPKIPLEKVILVFSFNKDIKCTFLKKNSL